MAEGILIFSVFMAVYLALTLVQWTVEDRR